MTTKLRIWDLPTRLFHWGFALAVFGAIITDLLDDIIWHSYCGYTALVLLIFRLIWGFIGPHHARFTTFIPTLVSLKAFFKQPSQTTLGHNPLGALSVMAMLGIVLVQAVSGLFTDDEIFFTGPMTKYVGESTVKLMNMIHANNHVLVYGIVALHLLAILYYQMIKKNNLLGPMLHGDKDIVQGEKNLPGTEVIASKDNTKIRLLAVLILIVLIGLFRYVVLR
jgi:cytochrome b